ncbi:MAG: glycoside hydrolase family 15 protein [Alphaproteobacteria bacterium]|nr:glycoside hydrolase family 15 protein [Alphaproteobacteria bacterium]
MAGRIEDYAMIGDMRTAALVCNDGSLDWLCLPRFDSSACFAALLGKSEHGRWLIAPKGKAKVRRRYSPGTLILETTFTTGTGRITLVDFMPVEEPHSSIIRLVIGNEGAVRLQTDLVIRFDYGISVPWVSRQDETTLTAVAGPSMLVLRTPVPLKGKDLRTQGQFTVRKGETVPFVMTYVPSHLPVPLPIDVEVAMAATKKFWTQWTNRANFDGKWREPIQRSLLTLKGLSYRPTGGIVAAVTTSLPEQIGGPRNWDYRYCWLRDAAFTLLAFLNAGYTEEAADWQHWLMRSIAGSPDQIQTMYGVAGERRLDEWEIDWLPGYENSAPVRVGNAAALQLQLDIYGELADTVERGTEGGLPRVPRRAEIRKVFLSHLESIWRDADEGIWEIRGAPQHFTHSKVMAWVAFDRASRSERLDRKERAHWQKVASQIHAHVCLHGIDPERNCFVQSYGSACMDASLLLLPMVGFLPAKDVRIKNTVREIEKHLMLKGLVLRYQTGTGVDGLPPGEGAFLACSFWLVCNYVLLGRLAEARTLLNKLIGLCNDVGLLAEEYDPHSKRMLGNFPQAFSHVALVNAALAVMHATAPKTKRRPVNRRTRPPAAKAR